MMRGFLLDSVRVFLSSPTPAMPALLKSGRPSETLELWNSLRRIERPAQGPLAGRFLLCGFFSVASIRDHRGEWCSVLGWSA
jgi:hypothetical protein